jgi:hypothetical protein
MRPSDFINEVDSLQIQRIEYALVRAMTTSTVTLNPVSAISALSLRESRLSVRRNRLVLRLRV